MEKTQGMLVAFATAADDVAQDGTGRNSPFTTALLKRLEEPGVEIGLMFRRVASDVITNTGGRQRPEIQISLLSEYYLNQNDRLTWDRIKDRDDVAALREFVIKYPSSPLAITARNRLDLLEARAREDERREAEAKRVAEEQKRREALRQQQEEQRRQEALRQQQEEQKRREALRRQQEEQASLLKRGEQFVAKGDLAAARSLFERAAEMRDARAAFALAETYDPIMLRRWGEQGFAPDIAMARTWYERAREFGSSEASQRLLMLASQDK